MSEYIKKEDILDASKIVYVEYLEIDDEGYIEGDADYFPVVFKKDIEKLSTIDIDTVEREHGVWEWHPYSADWVCIFCDYHSMEHTNYCPNCGANMR